jgi:hypothetical protein
MFVGILTCAILGFVSIALVVMSIVYCVKGPEAFKKKGAQVDENLQD